MKECYIDFANEVCKGLIGAKEEVKDFLRKTGNYDCEGKQRIRNRQTQKWEYVIVFSYMTYEGTGFVCFKAEHFLK